jgi:UDP-N-acetylglucosamine--N-acetylmuramyl-(pentapeptide) pyrophosphoryl-undecaprenol N-acetylglucosamine transferase
MRNAQLIPQCKGDSSRDSNNRQPNRLLLAAGGTAGHINPALAVADKFREVFPDGAILFLGTPNSMEERLVTKSGYDFKAVKLAGLQRSLRPKDMVRNVKAAIYLAKSAAVIKNIIRDFHPDFAIGTGGYVSLPVIRTAAKLGIPSFNHESNSLPGLATKALSRYVTKMFVAHEDTAKRLPYPQKCVVTGNPLRGDIPMEDRDGARKKLGLPEGLTILSFGGSKGSKPLNEAVAELIGWENSVGGINHIHAFGADHAGEWVDLLKEKQITPNPQRTIIGEYIYNMYTCYSAADIIISRSGAMTQSELKAAGRASIQIPWSGAAENHQYYNALTMAQGKAAVMIEDKDLTPQRLLAATQLLCAQPGKIKDMERAAASMAAKDAAGMILSEMLEHVVTR